MVCYDSICLSCISCIVGKMNAIRHINFALQMIKNQVKKKSHRLTLKKEPKPYLQTRISHITWLGPASSHLATIRNTPATAYHHPGNHPQHSSINASHFAQVSILHIFFTWYKNQIIIYCLDRQFFSPQWYDKMLVIDEYGHLPRHWQTYVEYICKNLRLYH